EIARTLHADAVVSGTVQRLGDTDYMTAQLELAKQDRTLWAQSYEGTRGDLLRMQRGVARAVTRRLWGALTPTQQAGLASGRPVPRPAAGLDPRRAARHALVRQNVLLLGLGRRGSGLPARACLELELRDWS